MRRLFEIMSEFDSFPNDFTKSDDFAYAQKKWKKIWGDISDALTVHTEQIEINSKEILTHVIKLFPEFQRDILSMNSINDKKRRELMRYFTLLRDLNLEIMLIINKIEMIHKLISAKESKKIKVGGMDEVMPIAVNLLLKERESDIKKICDSLDKLQPFAETKIAIIDGPLVTIYSAAFGIVGSSNKDEIKNEKVIDLPETNSGVIEKMIENLKKVESLNALKIIKVNYNKFFNQMNLSIIEQIKKSKREYYKECEKQKMSPIDIIEHYTDAYGSDNDQTGKLIKLNNSLKKVSDQLDAEIELIEMFDMVSFEPFTNDSHKANDRNKLDYNDNLEHFKNEFKKILSESGPNLKLNKLMNDYSEHESVLLSQLYQETTSNSENLQTIYNKFKKEKLTLYDKNLKGESIDIKKYNDFLADNKQESKKYLVEDKSRRMFSGKSIFNRKVKPESVDISLELDDDFKKKHQ